MRFKKNNFYRPAAGLIRGRLGEEYAAAYLLDAGYTIIQRNYRCRYGEIDIIAQKDVLIFVEVKVVEKTGLFSLENSVNYIKQKKIKSAAVSFLQSSDFCGDIRFDVLAVMLKSNEIVHYDSAF
jgi:putative endonuclease